MVLQCLSPSIFYDQGTYRSLEAKAVLRLIYAIAYAQVPPTLFTKQAATVEKTITTFGRSDISPASLQALDGLAILLFTPTYDLIFGPLATCIAGKLSGISIFNLMFAAIVETKRLKTAHEYQELFYDQVANELRSMGLPLSVGVGWGTFLAVF
ncbi:hypothetical protein Fmac_022827 [Flemingia macrophylla]|uniref:Uncharacterized protein n=1 Tax=Flemingia macrophylla TaxID=520843 RepID=A0ABD1M0T0_9FABA